MKRTQRACRITQTLIENPNKLFSLGFFAELFHCAKSSISEDIKAVRAAVSENDYGFVETTAGAKGGVRYIPYLSREMAIQTLDEIKNMFLEPDRVLGGGFLYTSDVMFSPSVAKGVAGIFARHFSKSEATCVVTVETKGIAIASFTAGMLDLPLIVLRRESKISEGSTVSINYFSGSADRIQKMSLAKRAIKPGEKALIIDDFMRGGGSIVGIKDMLREFEVDTVGIGVVVVANSDQRKNLGEYFPLLLLNTDKKSEFVCDVQINPQIIGEWL
ncbi:MAG: pur operon repressor [Clostridia bacterium]|nr:pur operon repressor [Clostridia bacterium]